MKNLYLKTIGALFLCSLIHIQSSAQGCVAIRSGCGVNVGGGAIIGQGQWQAGTNFRYFHSYKHFRGTHEETYRVEEGSEVINDSFFLDMLLSYGVTDRLTVNFTLPFVYHNRSSMYEHGGNPDPEENWPGDRNTTTSGGLSDIRISANYWLLDPAKSQGSNISVGLGMKFASGDYRAQGEFHNKGENGNQTITAGVDQSIQPGDGGTGATFEIQGYTTLSDNIVLSGNVYYLINPREKYSTTGTFGNSELSVPDQYAARLGAIIMTPVHGLFFYGGGRIEGIPSSDLIGGDEGFRRPGYAISLEPGLSYNIRNVAFNFTVPIAVERNRTKNFSDKENDRHGDAAFADYLINFGFSWRFGKSAPAIDAGDGPIKLDN